MHTLCDVSSPPLAILSFVNNHILTSLGLRGSNGYSNGGGNVNGYSGGGGYSNGGYGGGQGGAGGDRMSNLGANLQKQNWGMFNRCIALTWRKDTN